MSQNNQIKLKCKSCFQKHTYQLSTTTKIFCINCKNIIDSNSLKKCKFQNCEILTYKQNYCTNHIPYDYNTSSIISYDTFIEKLNLNISYNDIIFNKPEFKIILHIIYRYPEHDGYCSDPGSDNGEQYTEIATYNIPKNIFEIIMKNIQLKLDIDYDNLNLNLNLNIEKYNDDIISYFGKLFNNDDITCTKGSGYCGYYGYIKILNVCIKKY